MRIGVRLAKALLVALWLAAALPAIAEDRWIIPVYGSNVKGIGFTYDSVLAIGNPTSSIANVRVADIIPITSVPCAACRPSDLDLIIRPHETRRFPAGRPLVVGGQSLLFGAVVITADQPIELRSEVAGVASGIDYRWQFVEIARDWLTGPSRIDRAIRGDSETTNLFLINPNPFLIDIEYSTDRGGYGKTSVPPHSSVLRILDPTFWCPRGCAWIAITDPGRGVALDLNSSSPYLAAATNPSRLLAPVVRIPYALK